jgi:hypothetical protein
MLSKSNAGSAKITAHILRRVFASSKLSMGEGWTAIARRLNAEGVPTAHGGARWHASTVRAVVLSIGDPLTAERHTQLCEFVYTYELLR